MMKIPVISVIILVLHLVSCTAFAAHKENITVAHIDYNNFVTKTANGSYTGYCADYLKRIAEYTGWNYTFVDMDWPAAYAAVKAGEIDFYCVARQTEERQADFDFSLYPLCNEEMNIYTLPDRSIHYEDYQGLNGLKIGMLERSAEIDSFRQYAREKGFTFELVEYPRNEAVVEALRTGAVDAIALVNYSVRGALKLVGNFGVSPAYLMSRNGSSSMAEFSKAQERLFFDAPNFSQELEKTYYAASRHSFDLRLTRAEAAYIARAGTLSVALSPDMAPLEYYDKDSDTFRGVTVDLYQRIAALTGLKFRFVRRGNAPTLLSRMKKGDVRLVGALAQNAGVANALQLAQTRPFSESSFSVVAKNLSLLSRDSVVAVPAGYPMFTNIARKHGYSDIREYDGMEACVDAVCHGEADLAYVVSMSAGYLLDHAQYAELRSMLVNGTEYGICLGVSEVEPLLLSILNKSFAVIASHEINEMIVTNTMAAKPEPTLADTVKENGTVLMLVGIALIAFIALAMVRAQKIRQRQALDDKLRQHHNFLQHLYDTIPCGVFQYSYAAPHRILNYNAACVKIYGYEDAFPLMGQMADIVVTQGTEEAFQALFDLCEKTAGAITYTWPITRRDGSEAFTECVMDIVETEQGKVFQEVFIDVTERVVNEKLLEKRYMQELSRSGKRDEGLLYTACFDITAQKLTTTDIDIPGIRPGMSIAAFVAGLECALKDLQAEEDMEDFRTRFTPDRLQKAYDDGQYEHSFNLCRRNNGHIQWLRSELSLRHNPSTGHLMCFNYIWDVTDQRVPSDIMRRMALADCESFMCIDASTGQCLQYEKGQDGALAKSKAVYGNTDLIRQMARHMETADQEELILATDLAAVREHLAREARYQVYATLKGENGERRDKSLTYFYLDRKNDVLAAAVADVTAVRAGEVRHARLLADALEAAEKADAAKSQFLSRVSHEMRTPLNAIIGFIELAKDADAERAANCLASSDIAAKQLLNVINDVLDMSSIASGKMTIANTCFNFRHMISSITNVYGVQCRQKGVMFETKIATPTEDWLVGDELRVNQVLMNLLGNAVKFTAEGHIWLTVSQTAVKEDTLFLRFAIADSGCGMSEEMKQRLFRPFEQESAVTARKYGGSGLGLSIVKNLVRLMNGTIRVESRQGAGTTFIVDLPFRRSDVGRNILLPRQAGALRILAVDDEASEREYMHLVLTRMGVRFTCVGSGSEALEELERADNAQDSYNVCLIDWRMPAMNGIDATRRIRRKYGKEVVVIVVSAYDFQQAGDSAREAGADLFLSKPLFQSSLFDLLMTLTGGNIALPKEKPQAWNFAGRRVLLAEDNVLNQIVVKGYLAKYNVVVDLAENGQMAVEKFLAAAPGWYDAILMDVQMPVMDGYGATRAIRESAHPEAKTIQIIAQTADAFTEDVARALAAGMNAHVAKPIKLDVLGTALHKAFSLRDEAAGSGGATG